METLYEINDKPSAVRFPRGNGYGIEVMKDLFGTEFENNELPARGKALEIGKGRIVKLAAKQHDSVSQVGRKYRCTILSIGTRLHDSVLAARAIEKVTHVITLSYHIISYHGHIITILYHIT